MNCLRPLLAVALGSIWLVSPCFAEPLTVESIGSTAERLLAKSKFVELEQMVSGYIEDDTHLVGGNSAIYHFYGALGCYAGAPRWDYSSPMSRAAKLGLLEGWLAKRPSSSTARIALAQFWSTEAWAVRGGEYADHVPDRVWASFHESLDKSNSYLSGVGVTADPHLSYLQIANLKGEGSPRPRLDSLYEKAIKRRPTYFHYYSQRAIILQERWFGERGELASYAQSLLTRPGSDRGKVAYAYVASALIGLYQRSTFLKTTGLRWSDVQAGYSTRRRLYGLRNRDWNALCNLSLAAVDRATAADALGHIGTNWDPEIWKERKYFDAAVAWIRKP